MRNFMILPAIFVLLGSFQAQAKTYYSANAKTALITYFVIENEIINAVTCEDVELGEAVVIGRTLRTTKDLSQVSKCESLTVKGLSKADVHRNLQGILDEEAKANKNDPEALEQLKAVTTESFFGQLVVETRLPMLEQISRQDLIKMAEDFIKLTK